MDVENKVMELIEEGKDEIVELLKEFIRIPSMNPPGEEGKLAPLVADFIKKIGLNVKIEEALPSRPTMIGSLKRGWGPIH